MLLGRFADLARADGAATSAAAPFMARVAELCVAPPPAPELTAILEGEARATPDLGALTRGSIARAFVLFQRAIVATLADDDEALAAALEVAAAAASVLAWEAASAACAPRPADLAARVESLRPLIDALPISVVIAGRDGALHANPATSIIWAGVAPIDAHPRSKLRVWDGDTGRELALEETPLVRALEHGATVAGELLSVEFEDGIRKTLLVSAAPLLDDEGRRLGAIAVTEDVSEKLAPIGLAAESEARHRFLTQASKVLSESLDYEATLAKIATLAVPGIADWCIVDVLGEGDVFRRVAVVHKDPAKRELTEELARDFTPSSASRGVPSYVLRTRQPLLIPNVSDAHMVATARGPRHAEIIAALGSRSYMCVPMMARGRLVGALTLVSSRSRAAYEERDLAFAAELSSIIARALENARAYEDAKRAIRLREDIVSIVSHDLKTPLMAVLMAAATLERTSIVDPGADLVRRQAERIRRSAEHMHRLVSDLLDVAKIEAGPLALDLAEHDLVTVVDEAMEMFRPIAADKGVALGLQIDAGAHRLAFDRERIVQVLSNLLGNALKFTPEGGRVTVRVTGSQQAERVLVEDSGPGIAPDDLPRVFDRFWQASPTAKQGAGLGLAITKGIVESHGGAVGVESAPGAGATFWFSLPRRP